MKCSTKTTVAIVTLILGTASSVSLAGPPGHSKSAHNAGKIGGSGKISGNISGNISGGTAYANGQSSQLTFKNSNKSLGKTSIGKLNSQPLKQVGSNNSKLAVGTLHKSQVQKCLPTGPGKCNPSPICKPPHIIGGCWNYPPYYHHCWDSCYPIFYGCGTYAPVVVEVPGSPIIIEQPPMLVGQELPANGETTPVASTAPVSENRMSVRVGGTIELENQKLGEKAGQVVLQLEQVALPIMIREWKDDKLTAAIPMFGLAGPSKADLFIVRADGQVANVVPVELLPAQPPTQPQP
jgi:hypothetical protein